MVDKGLVEEARSMYPFRSLHALKTVGYVELLHYFDGEYDLDRAIELIKQNTRRYAKRQLSWLRNQTDTNWLRSADLKPSIDLINTLRDKIGS